MIQHARERLAVTHEPKIGFILGTGWSGALQIDPVEGAKHPTSLKLEELASFRGNIRQLDGHPRELSYGSIDGTPVLVLRGRLHLNEEPHSAKLYELVRAQTELLIGLGCTHLVVTAAVGSLLGTIPVGSIVIPDGFITLFAPAMPLFSGEFVSPEDAISSPLRELALQSVQEVTGKEARSGAYAMVLGPFFEGRKYDKAILRMVGASVVGMSCLPEACIAAVHSVPIVVITHVTNNDSEVHSHETNQHRSHEKAQELGAILTQLALRMRPSLP